MTQKSNKHKILSLITALVAMAGLLTFMVTALAGSEMIEREEGYVSASDNDADAISASDNDTDIISVSDNDPIPVPDNDVESVLAPSTLTQATSDDEDADEYGVSLLNTYEDLTSGNAYISDFYISSIVDGTADFDGDDEPGNDSSASNGIVRSFDTITYNLSYSAASYEDDAEYLSAVIYFEFILPMSSTEAEWDTDTMSWMDEGWTVTEDVEVTYDFDGNGYIEDDEENVICQVLRGKRTLTGLSAEDVVIPGSGTLAATVQVLASSNETVVTPVFTVWLHYNRAGDIELENVEIVTENKIVCSTHNEIEQKTVAANQKYDDVKDSYNKNYAVTVSATLKLNVQIDAGSSSYTAFNTTYNLDEGNEYALDMGAGEVTGGVSIYAITLQLYNDAGKGFKGIEYPTGPITFEVEISTSFVATASGESLTAQQQATVMENYTPLVLSWGPQQDAVYDGRTLTNISYTMMRSPANSGMTTSDLSTGSMSCYNGGTWMATKSGNTIYFTVTDYEIIYPLFPNANQGTTRTSSTYYSLDTGLENIGCFSAGKLFILTPYYNNKTGEQVLYDYDVTEGNFYTTITDVNLQATSVSGQSLKVVDDNSNQMATTDDTVTTTVYLERPGTYDWIVGWTQLNCYGSNHVYDVLKRSATNTQSWVRTGQNALVVGSEVALGVGVINGESGDANNRLCAADVLCKFDGSAVTLTGEISVWRFSSYSLTGTGWDVTILYATKTDGKNWENDEEMNGAEIEDLVYYSSLNEVPEGHVVVAYLAEFRAIDNDITNIQKVYEGSRLIVTVGATINDDDSLIGNVYQCVVGGKLWRVAEYEAAGGEIPTMAGHGVDGTKIVLPESTVTDYAEYTKAYYDESGYAGGHTGDWDHGDSLLILGTTPAISKSVAQTESSGSTKSNYQLDNGEFYIDYRLVANFTGMPDGVSAYTTITITDTLEEGLTYVDGSSYLGGNYTQDDTYSSPGTVEGGTSYEPGVTINSDGTTTLTWTLTDVYTEDEIIIHYSVQIDTTKVSNNDTLTNYVTIKSTGDLRDFSTSNGNLATVSITVAMLTSTAVSKVPEHTYYDVGDDMTFTINVVNSSGVAAMTNAVILDTLPYSGDSIGSDFEGDLYVTAVKVATSSITNLSSWTCYYTTSEAARDTTSSRYIASDIIAGTSTINGETVTWVKATIDTDTGTVTGIPDNEVITAIAWVGTINPSETFTATVALSAPDAEAGDVIVNRLSRGTDSTSARVYIAERSITGLAWLDSDEDGQRSGEDLLTGIKVVLLQKNSNGDYEVVKDVNDDEVYVITAIGTEDREETYTIEFINNAGNTVQLDITAIAKADGSYEFSGLPAGTYGIRFTSSDDISDNTNKVNLAKFIASPVNEGEDYTDSDGVPTYDDNTDVYKDGENLLLYTTITEIELPVASQLGVAYYYSRYNDSGFYYRNGSISIQKNDDSGKGMDGVVFMLEIYDEDTDTWSEVEADTNTTSEGGKLIYEDLTPGKYRLTEVATLEGYTLLAEPIEITIPYGSSTAEGTESYIEDGIKYYLDLTYTIQNGQILEMPIAGTTVFTARHLMLFGACAASLATAAFMADALRRKRRLRILKKSLSE